jgi:SET domain-containing protein
MARKPFRVGRSKTGLGLFATDFIPKGTLIVEYRGRRMRNADADKLADRGAKYLYEINNRWTIDGSNRRNVARYANHSCRPNAESDVTRERKVVIRSIKKIQPGDEITYDYGSDYFDLIIKPLGCKCDKCTGKGRGRHKVPRKKHRAKKAQARKAESKTSARAA